MKLAQLFSDFEEELIRQGEEAESLFVYRSLKIYLYGLCFCPPAGSDGRGRSICKRNFPNS